MSTVQEFDECPQCKGVCITEFNTRTQEEIRICFKCGRREKWLLERDDENQVILDEDGNPQMGYDLHEGKGVANILRDNGNGSLMAFNNITDEEAKKVFQQELSENENVDKENSYLTSWDSKKQEVISVFGPMPPSFEEFEKDNQDEEN